jgi:hypothetical protein
LNGQISIDEKDLIDAKNVNTKNNKYNII